MSRQGIVVTGVEKGKPARVSITGTARRGPPRSLPLEKKPGIPARWRQNPSPSSVHQGSTGLRRSPSFLLQRGEMSPGWITRLGAGPWNQMRRAAGRLPVGATPVLRFFHRPAGRTRVGASG